MRIRARISAAFWIAVAGGLLVLGAAGQWFWGEYRERQDRLAFTANLELPRLHPPLPVSLVPPPPVSGVGVLRMPRLGLEVLIRRGSSHATLAQGAGWIPGTALPGKHGNVGVAAHRDTFFRPLRNVRLGDQLTLLTPDGERHYRVQETRIVEPSAVSVLAPTRQDTVTLVTCYPFDYLGSAPQRFIVSATLVPPPPV